MKKIICLLLIILTLFTCTACGTVFNMDLEESKGSFVLVESEQLGAYHYRIVYHKETKVMYTVGYYSDFAVMLNPDGSPMVWEEE